VCEFFSEHCEGAAIKDIDRPMVATFLDRVTKLDARWARYRGAKRMTFEKLLEKFPGTMAPASTDKWIGILSGVFKRALKRGDTQINPFVGQRPVRPKLRPEPIFTIGELNMLLAGVRIGGEPGIASVLYWMVPIALFSGLRQGEIAQLRKQDIRCDGGINYFNVTAESGSLKTAAATRIVPVHSEIVRMGFLDFVSAIDGRLFPWVEGKAPNALADGFSKIRHKIGLGRKGLHFHTLRKCFTTALDRAGVPREDVAAIVGHSRGFTFSVYSDGPGLKRLAEAIAKVRYEGLKL
jgi:integrase